MFVGLPKHPLEHTNIHHNVYKLLCSHTYVRVLRVNLFKLEILPKLTDNFRMRTTIPFSLISLRLFFFCYLTKAVVDQTLISHQQNQTKEDHRQT